VILTSVTLVNFAHHHPYLLFPGGCPETAPGKTSGLSGSFKLNKKGNKPMPTPKQPYVIVRTYSAGVFAGYLVKRKGQEVELKDARRIWYWSGAASLSQLAVDGTADPKNCKFPVAVPKVELTQAIEILTCTPKAKKSIQEVPEWKK